MSLTRQLPHLQSKRKSDQPNPDLYLSGYQDTGNGPDQVTPGFPAIGQKPQGGKSGSKATGKNEATTGRGFLATGKNDNHKTCYLCLFLNLSRSSVYRLVISISIPSINTCVMFVPSSKISPSARTTLAIFPFSKLPNLSPIPNISAG